MRPEILPDDVVAPDIVFGAWTKRDKAVRRRCTQCDANARAERHVWRRTVFRERGVSHEREHICLDCLATGHFEPFKPIDATKEQRP